MFEHDMIDLTESIGGSRISPQSGLGVDLLSEEEHYSDWLDTLEDLPRLLEYSASDRAIADPLSFFNPTNWSSQQNLPLRRSALIDQATSVFKQAMSGLRSVFGFRQIDLERIDSVVVDSELLLEGQIVFTAEVFPLGNSGMNFSYESFPLRRSRVTIPLQVCEGTIYPPTQIVDAQLKEYPYSVEGFRAALRIPEDRKPFIRRRAPRVTRSWDIPRDYRAF